MRATRKPRFAGIVIVLLLASCAQLKNEEPVRLSTPNELVVKRWVDDYETAWNLHDQRRIQILAELNAAELIQVQHKFDESRDYTVKISNVRVREFAPGNVVATFMRVDRWIDAKSGRANSSSGSYEHSFHVVDGRARLVAVKRR